MSARRESFDDALDAAIDALRSGRPLATILEEHAAHAHHLQPLLELSTRVHSDVRSAVPPLAANFSIVRAAIRREKRGRASATRNETGTKTPWWARRAVFASLSLPVGAIIAAVVVTVGTTSATASVVATHPALPGRVTHALRETWVAQLLPVGSGGTEPEPTPSLQVAATQSPAATVAAIAPGPPAVAAAVTTTSVTGAATTAADLGPTLDRSGDHTPDPPTDQTPGPPADHTQGPPVDHTQGPPADHTPGPPIDHTPHGPGKGKGRNNKP